MAEVDRPSRCPLDQAVKLGRPGQVKEGWKGAGKIRTLIKRGWYWLVTASTNAPPRIAALAR
jgi:hypothetical protein